MPTVLCAYCERKARTANVWQYWSRLEQSAVASRRSLKGCVQDERTQVVYTVSVRTRRCIMQLVDNSSGGWFDLEGYKKSDIARSGDPWPIHTATIVLARRTLMNNSATNKSSTATTTVPECSPPLVVNWLLSISPEITRRYFLPSVSLQWCRDRICVNATRMQLLVSLQNKKAVLSQGCILGSLKSRWITACPYAPITTLALSLKFPKK